MASLGANLSATSDSFASSANKFTSGTTLEIDSFATIPEGNTTDLSLKLVMTGAYDLLALGQFTSVLVSGGSSSDLISSCKSSVEQLSNIPIQKVAANTYSIPLCSIANVNTDNSVAEQLRIRFEMYGVRASRYYRGASVGVQAVFTSSAISVYSPTVGFVYQYPDVRSSFDPRNLGDHDAGDVIPLKLTVGNVYAQNAYNVSFVDTNAIVPSDYWMKSILVDS